MAHTRAWIAAISCVPLILCGCAYGRYSVHSEEQFFSEPDMSEACGFVWRSNAVWFCSHTYEFQPNLAWLERQDPNSGGLPNRAFIEELPKKCAATANRDAKAATITAYYMESASDLEEVIDSFLIGLTLDMVPVPYTHYYVACVEAVSGTFSRAAFSKGRLEASYSTLISHSPGLGLKIKQLLQDLTVQAWHKLWTPGQSLPQNTDCRAALLPEWAPNGCVIPVE